MDAEPDYGLDTITTIHVLSGYQRRLDEIVTEENTMNRLREKLTEAANVARDAIAKIEARADSLIARRSDIDGKTDRAFRPHELLLDDAESGLNEVEEALRIVSNGGPPLEGLEPASADSSPTQP